MDDHLKQNTIIFYNIDKILTGYGKIVGLGTNDKLPIIGRSYIIDPEIPIQKTISAYSYSHLLLFETQFRVLTISEVRKRKLDKINGII